MAKLMGAGVVCALVLCLQAAWAQTTVIGVPPEDLDSSGDDDDAFSGSGAGSLPDHPVDASTFSLQESTNSSLTHVVHADLRDDQSEAGTGSPIEDPEIVSVLPTSDMVTDKPAVAVEEELDSFTEQVTRPAVITTRIPATHHTSTVRITTSQSSSTTEVVEPKVHHETYHDTAIIGKDMPTSDVAPTSESSLDAFISITSSSPHKDISSLPEEVLSPEDGSGDAGDFIFSPEDNMVKPREFEPENRAVDPGANDEKSAAAPQGIMDRKEVLGGVIAGGLVGLLFAGVLVGFMLYRVKKKDEGSYSLDEPKQSNGGYQKPHKQEEFYA